MNIKQLKEKLAKLLELNNEWSSNDNAFYERWYKKDYDELFDELLDVPEELKIDFEELGLKLSDYGWDENNECFGNITRARQDFIDANMELLNGEYAKNFVQEHGDYGLLMTAKEGAKIFRVSN